jgi:hypothetical protein
MVLNKTSIKNMAGISVTTYDTIIDNLIPIILNKICNSCNNDFIKINYSNYPVYKKGNLVIIGGAEDKYGESKILEEVVDIMGGDDARVGIITTATQHPDEVGEDYRNRLTIPSTR